MNPTRARLLAGGLLLLAASAVAAGPVRIVTTPDVLDDYRRLYAHADPLAVDYEVPGQRRDVVELLLVQQALRQGGIAEAPQFITAPTYRRMLALVADGHADLTGNTVWDFDVRADTTRLRASSQLIADGNFLANFYRASGQTAIGDRIRRGEWTALRAVSSRHWEPDWQALSSLGLAEVADVPDWPAMVRMVAAGRADFLLAPALPPGQPILLVGNVQLEPVAGVCLAFNGARTLAIGRHSPPELYAALERGLAELRGHGRIARAYDRAGFLTDAQRRCRRLNP
jgi:hypothetical protein